MKMLQYALSIEDKEEDYRLRSLQLLGVKILTYFVAMTSPSKHITNTFAMGKTANFNILKMDSDSQCLESLLEEILRI